MTESRPKPPFPYDLHARIVGGLVVEYLVVPHGHVADCAVWRGPDVDAARRERDRRNAPEEEPR